MANLQQQKELQAIARRGYERRFLRLIKEHVKKIRSIPVPLYGAPTILSQAPSDVTVSVFAHMDRRTLLNARSVCRRWLVLTTRAPVHLLDLPNKWSPVQLESLLVLFPKTLCLSVPLVAHHLRAKHFQLLNDLLHSSSIPSPQITFSTPNAKDLLKVYRRSSGASALEIALLLKLRSMDSQDFVQGELPQKLVRAYMNIYNFVAAESEVREMVKQFPSNADARVLLAEVLFEDGQLQEALRVLRQLKADVLHFRLTSQYVTVLVKCCLEAGPEYYQMALDDINTAIEYYRANSYLTPFNYLFHRATLLWTMNKLRAAENDLRTLLSRNAVRTDVLRALGDVLFEQERMDEAWMMYGRLLSLDSTDADGWQGMGDALVASWRWNDAIDAYSRSLELSRKKQNLTAPSRIRRKIVDCSINAEVSVSDVITDETARRQRIALLAIGHKLSKRALCYLSLKQFHDAMRDYAEYISLDPNNPNPYSRRAEGYMKAQRFDLALADIEFALKMNPLNPRLWSQRAQIQMHMRNFEQALADIDKSLILRRDIENSAHGQHLVFRGYALFHQGRIEEALAQFRSVFAKGNHSDKLPALNALCRVLLSQGQFLEAHQLLSAYQATLAADDETLPLSLAMLFVEAERGLHGSDSQRVNDLIEYVYQIARGGVHPRAPRDWQAIGLAFYEKGQYQTALEWMNRTIESVNHFYDYYNQRALCYLKLGQHESALQDLKESLQLSPQQPKIAELAASLSTNKFA